MLSSQAIAYRAILAAQALPVLAYTKGGKLLGVYADRTEAESMHHASQVTLELSEADAADYAAWEAANPAPAAQLPKGRNGKVDRFADRLKASKFDKPVAFVHAYVYANKDKARKDLIAELVELGVAFYTARTQVQAALKAAKDNPELYKAEADTEAEAE